jgi:uncharacterized phiE125 gp8 family phage protein
MITPSTALRLVTPPAVTPINLADAKEQCRVSHDEEDGYLTDLVEAAVALVDARGMLGRAMINQTWAEYFPNAPGEVRLSMTPFVSLTSVKYLDDAGVYQTATLGNFETYRSGDYVFLRPKEGSEWPEADIRKDAYEITYLAGFGATAADVPAGLRHALKLIVGHWYQNREAAGAMVHEFPLAVAALIETQRVSWYG